MKLKEFQLDIEALISELINGHGFLHYGYWESTQPDVFSLDRIGRAQKAYCDLLISKIGPESKTILDVGSGTGGNAKYLIEKGYSVTCVCPSSRLNALARAKLPPTTRIIESYFEDIDEQQVFDTLVFSESFHYIDSKKALEKLKKICRRSFMIFDYFPRQDPGARSYRQTYDNFQRNFQTILGSEFVVESDQDLTAHIAPTFAVTDRLKNDYVRPFSSRLIEQFRNQHPIYAFMAAPWLRKLERKATKISNRFETFPAEYEYRLLVVNRCVT